MTKDPILSTPSETVVWDLADGSPMPATGVKFVVIVADYEMDSEGHTTRTIRHITLVD